MRYSTAILATATIASALSVARPQVGSNGQNVINFDGTGSDEAVQCLIETSEGETKWVDEDEKWEMRRVG